MKQIDFDAIPDVRPATLTTSRDVLIQTIGEHILLARTQDASWTFAGTFSVVSRAGEVHVDGVLAPDATPLDPAVPSTQAYDVGAYALQVAGADKGRISVIGFRSRFTPEERTMIELAACDTPGAALDVRRKAAALRAYLADLASAKFVDLRDARTAAGVRHLEDAAIIGAGRAAEILGAPASDGEAP